MTLIKSISGIRGTIGGAPGDNLTPIDVVKFTSAYASFIRSAAGGGRVKIVVGRDARLSGAMVDKLVQGTLLGCGADVIDVGLCTTPGVEVAVTEYGADGGIILTASHNPRQWNALKLLDAQGEFLSGADGAEILRLAEAVDSSHESALSEANVFGMTMSSHPDGACQGDGGAALYADVDGLGKILESANFDARHIAAVLALPLVDAEAVRARRFRVVVDAVNSVGGVVIPELLKRLGCEVVCLNCEPTGEFAHNPEPLPENLTGISAAVVREKADLGIVVDPDVDRLALVNDDGTMFGEEYTLVAVADYVLSKTPGNTVSNLSSSRALRDVTERRGGKYSASAVGEVNVVAEMKATGAVIGGEGNGGVIYPALHYGRDALVGIALFLTHLAHSGKTMTELRASYPEYYISKNKMELTPEIDVDKVLDGVKKAYAGEKVTDIDGVKIDFADGWVHLRKSNTEPIIRIYSEAADRASADRFARLIIDKISEIAGLK